MEVLLDMDTKGSPLCNQIQRRQIPVIFFELMSVNNP